MWKKIVVVVLIVSLVTFGGLFFLSYTSPTEYAVTRETTINASKEEVFAYVKMLKNQNEWGPWFKKDPTMQQEFRGTDGQPGFVASWKGGSETGEGEQEIKKVTDSQIETELRFKKPFEASANSTITTAPAGEGQTKVTWAMKGDVPRPMNLLLLVMDMDKEAGKDFAEGLATLKAKMEAQQ